MAASGRLLPIAETISRTVEGRLIGESGHRNFDAKPRAYEFASGGLGVGSGRSDQSAVLKGI